MAGKKSYSKRKSTASKKQVKKVITRELVKRGLNKPEIKRNVYSFVGTLATSVVTSGTQLDPTKQGDNNYILNGAIYPTTTPGGAVVGNKIVAKGLHLKWRFYNSDTNSHVVRMLVVCDHDPTSSATLLPYTGANLGTNGNIFLSADISSILAPPTNRRFKVLYDKQFVISGDDDNKSLQIGSKYIKLHNAYVNYALDDTNTEALVSNNRKYNLYLFADTVTYISCAVTADFTFCDV